MEVDQVLHMVTGDGETSYASNSSVQKLALSQAIPFIKDSIRELSSNSSHEELVIADLGCSSGPNTLSVISEIIRTACDYISENPNRSDMEILAFLNDLPGNDFNTLFKSLQPFYERMKSETKGGEAVTCYISAMPGSFYSRLFPKRSLHFVHSCYSVHWLSRVPPGLVSDHGVHLNKGNVNTSYGSPPVVFEAYLKQFKIDFSSFLKLRSEEMVPGGHMVLTLASRRKGEDPTDYHSGWAYISENLQQMVKEGIIEEDKLDSFDLPFFEPTLDEVEEIIVEEGSFSLTHAQICHAGIQLDVNGISYSSHDMTATLTKVSRAVIEPILKCHFAESVTDELFRRVGLMDMKTWIKHWSSISNLLVSLTKKCPK